MANTTKKNTKVEKNEERTEGKRNQLFALWKQKSKDGKTTYFTGKANTGISLRAFYNTKKKNPNEPDLRIYTYVDGETSKENVGAMWCNASKKDNTKKYLSGTFDGVKVIAFFNSTDNEKAPYITAYVSEERAEATKEEKEAVQTEFEEIPDEETLPF